MKIALSLILSQFPNHFPLNNSELVHEDQSAVRPDPEWARSGGNILLNELLLK